MNWYDEVQAFVQEQVRAGDQLLDLGDMEQARECYALACAALSELAVHHPTDLKLHQQRFDILCKSGDLNFERGDLARANVDYGRASEAAQALCEIDSSSPDSVAAKASIALKNGDVSFALGDVVSAARAFQQAFELFTSLQTKRPGDTRWHTGLSFACDRLGDVHRSCGDVDAARAAYESALQHLQEVARLQEWEDDQSVLLAKLGQLHLQRGHLDVAHANFGEAHALITKLAQGNEYDVRWQRELSVSWQNLAAGQDAQGDSASAAVCCRSAVAILDRLVSADPDNLQWQYDFVCATTLLAELSVKTGDLSAALGWSERACIVSSQFGNATSLTVQSAHAAVLEQLGGLHLLVADYARARNHHAEALAIRIDMAFDGRSARIAYAELAGTYERIAATWRSHGHLHEVVHCYQQALQRVESSVHAHQSAAMRQRQRAVALHQLAAITRELGQLEQSIAYSRRELNALQSTAADGHEPELWCALVQLGDLHLQRDALEALRYHQRALQVADDLVGREPDNPDWLKRWRTSIAKLSSIKLDRPN